MQNLDLLIDALVTSKLDLERAAALGESDAALVALDDASAAIEVAILELQIIASVELRRLER